MNYKNAIVNAGENDTVLIMKKIGLIRGIKNKFTEKAKALELSGASHEELKDLLGKKKERLGIFEGDVENGILEAGNGVGLIHEIKSVAEIMQDLTN